jgi:hypothetical protein
LQCRLSSDQKQQAVVTQREQRGTAIAFTGPNFDKLFCKKHLQGKLAWKTWFFRAKCKSLEYNKKKILSVKQPFLDRKSKEKYKFNRLKMK